MTATAGDLDTIYECSPRQIAEFVEDSLFDGTVPNILSSPGMGKSSIVHSVFRKFGLHLIDYRASTSDPTDYNGLPKLDGDVARFVPFTDNFPIESTPIPDGCQGFGIFLDEYNTAPRSIQAAGYKLVLDRMVGQFKLHPNTAIVMAGNHDTDGAITNPMGTAMKSRVITLHMRTDFQEWLEDVAIPQNYDPRIIAYLHFDKEALNDFDPDRPGAFACQRTWEFMNRMITDRPVLDSKMPRYIGAIGGQAVKFVQYTKVFQHIPSIRDVVNDPLGHRVPQDAATRWAVVMMLASQVDKDSFDKVAMYIENGFPIENRILFYRTAVAKNGSLVTHPGFQKTMVQMSQKLHGTDKQLGQFAPASKAA